MSSNTIGTGCETRRGIGKAITPVLSVLGIGVSSYLLYLKLGGSAALCTGFGGCDTVNASLYSLIAGVPVSLMGLLGYVAILGLSLWRLSGGPWSLSFAIFGMALIGFLYSAYLTYLELFVILAVCPWCVASALLMSGVLGDSWRFLDV